MRFALLLPAAIALLSCIRAQAQAQAETGKPDAAFITATRSGRFFFKMVPTAGQPAHGAAFEVLADGSLKELWQVSGWYARELFLSEDGRSLVRLEPRNPGRSVSKTDLALAFYNEGALVREYHTAELVKDGKKVLPGKHTYDWLAPVWVTLTDSRKPDGTSRVERDREAEPVLDAAGIFKLKTCDRIVYQFEASTGRLVKRTVY